MRAQSLRITAFMVLAALGQLAGAAVLQFAAHPIAGGLRGGYHVVATDVDADGLTDLVALASGTSELVWYRNPGWERFVIVGGRNRMINCAAADTDGDRIPEIVLAEGFENDPSKSIGVVSLLCSKSDPRQPWDVREIDRLPTSHRIRVARAGKASGEVVFVNAPLAGAQARPPDYREAIPLVLYRPGRWERETISNQIQGVMHGIAITDWNGDGRDDLLTASFEGLHLLLQDPKGWRLSKLTAGDPAPWPKGGSSDVAVGKIAGQRFLAAIEPWHGDEIVVYRGKGRLARTVIDQSLPDGHTLLTADFDKDGIDEILVGFRRGRAVVVYKSADRTAKLWQRVLIDESINAAGCAVADLNGDSRLDFACIGSTSADLKWYENLGAR